MTRTSRKSYLIQRAAALGVASAVSFLRANSLPVPASVRADSQHAGQNNAGESPADLLAPVPAPAYNSANPFLHQSERVQLAAEVRAYHLANDSQAWHAGKARGNWLAVVS